MFGGDALNAQSLDDLLGPEASRVLQPDAARSLRMGVVSREIENSRPLGGCCVCRDREFIGTAPRKLQLGAG